MVVHNYHHLALNRELQRPLHVITYRLIIAAIIETTALTVIIPGLLLLAAIMGYGMYDAYIHGNFR
jgi:hypothetical protein